METNLIEMAKTFAHNAHDSVGQKRKYTGEKYWFHTDEVAATVTSYFPDDVDMICAAHCHDVLEDVNTFDFDARTIEQFFGPKVLQYVIELTDVFTKENYPNKLRRERKALEAQRISKISIGAKNIKLADLLSNTKSIVEHDPEFARTYLQEKFNLLNRSVMEGTDGTLLHEARNQCMGGFIQLNLEPTKDGRKISPFDFMRVWEDN